MQLNTIIIKCTNHSHQDYVISKSFLLCFMFFMPLPWLSLYLGSSADFSSSPLLSAILDFSPLPPSQAKKAASEKQDVFAPGQSHSSHLQKQKSLQITLLGNLSHCQCCYFTSLRCITCWWLFSPATDWRLLLLDTYQG